MKQFILTVAMLTLFGCVSGQYQPYSTSVGYASEHQKDNIYTVTYTGSRSTKIEKVNDFALLRSAELTLEEGYNYFVIVEATNNKIVLGSATNFSLDDADRTNYSIAEGGGHFGSRNQLSSPIRAIPKSKLVIHLFTDKPETIAYDAKLIDKALKDEYEIILESEG